MHFSTCTHQSSMFDQCQLCYSKYDDLSPSQAISVPTNDSTKYRGLFLKQVFNQLELFYKSSLRQTYGLGRCIQIVRRLKQKTITLQVYCSAIEAHQIALQSFNFFNEQFGSGHEGQPQLLMTLMNDSRDWQRSNFLFKNVFGVADDKLDQFYEPIVTTPKKKNQSQNLCGRFRSNPVTPVNQLSQDNTNYLSAPRPINQGRLLEVIGEQPDELCDQQQRIDTFFNNGMNILLSTMSMNQTSQQQSKRCEKQNRKLSDAYNKFLTQNPFESFLNDDKDYDQAFESQNKRRMDRARKSSAPLYQQQGQPLPMSTGRLGFHSPNSIDGVVKVEPSQDRCEVQQQQMNEEVKRDEASNIVQTVKLLTKNCKSIDCDL